MRKTSGPIENLFGQHVRMSGAKGVEPVVIRQRLAEPRRGLVNRRALRAEDLLQLLARHSVIFFVSVHLNVAHPSCLRARQFASFAGSETRMSRRLETCPSPNAFRKFACPQRKTLSRRDDRE